MANNARLPMQSTTQEPDRRKHGKAAQNRRQTPTPGFLARLRFVLFVVIQIEHIGHKIVVHTDTPLIGYIHYRIASFLEEYDFSKKTIIPFCSHGGGRFGQSLTAIAKLAPDAIMGEGLSVHYSGGSALTGDVAAWLETNGIKRK